MIVTIVINIFALVILTRCPFFFGASLGTPATNNADIKPNIVWVFPVKNQSINTKIDYFFCRNVIPVPGGPCNNKNG